MNEEEHFFQDRKEEKRERKMASKTDRSKYKKTDFEKREALVQESLRKKMSQKNLHRGHVLSIMPEEILVECDHVLYKCVLKGILKREMGRIKNLVVVGDFVLFDHKTLAIFFIEKRTSFLSKRAPIQDKKEQYIASNIDYVIITASVVSPPLNLPLIDRYIIATRKGNMEPLIVINKIDLLEAHPEEKSLFEKACAIYTKLNISIIGVSAKTGESIAFLKSKMANHSAVFAGESGVGKTSLINIVAELNLATKEVAEKIQRGTHTTTSASLIPLAFGGFCIDTPGIQKFGIWDLKREDLDHYFPEISEVGRRCHYLNCTHTHEPECAVREAILKNEISALRLASYFCLIEEIPLSSKY